MKKWFLVLSAIIVTGIVLLPMLDASKIDGELTVAGLKQPVRVLRDKQGIPSIYADSLHDAMLARGFISAQDRLFQMEIFRHLSQGKLAEFIGERGIKNDRLARILNIAGLAKQQEALLDADERAFNQAFIDGINAFLSSGEALPVMMQAMGHTPTPWTMHDVLSIQLFVGWGSAVNWRQELLMLDIIDQVGQATALQLAPLTANPDRSIEFAGSWQQSPHFFETPDKRKYWGSNAWTSDGKKSGTGSAIVSGDPHLDSRQLPGFWYPLAMITPELRVIGTSAPGVPAIGVGRNSAVAWSATNGYSDIVDLFNVTLDPEREDHYLYNGESVALQIRQEVLRIKDSESTSGYREEVLRIRSTAHGPLISDHGMQPASYGQTDNGHESTKQANKQPNQNALLLRWSGAETLASRSGNLDILFAKTTRQARSALSLSTTPLNYLVGDKQGNILRQATGRVPKRQGDGLQVLPYAPEYVWQGFIGFDAMPFEYNPAAGWTGSANHDIVPDNYPYAYSTHFSPSWRYRRLQQLFAADTTGIATHQQALMDTKNVLAEQHLPQLLALIADDTGLATMHQLLNTWNYFDDPNESGATLFQAWMRAIATRTFGDELGEQRLAHYLKSHYVWQERLFAMLQQGDSPLFDITTTDTTEDRDAIVLLAAHDALTHVQETLGDNSDNWQWGRYHSITFFHAFFPGNTAAKWLGGGTHPGAGSPETLNRGASPFDTPRETTIMPSMRIVMDMSHDNYVLAHIPGGNSERLFNPWNKSQLPQYLNGEFNRWWFSDAEIERHKQHELTLNPR